MMRGATLPKLTECRVCHEPIRFVRMDATGRHMPINPTPRTEAYDAPGQVAARLHGPGLAGYVITAERRQDDRHPYRFTPHYATCDQPTKKTPPTPEPDPALF